MAGDKFDQNKMLLDIGPIQPLVKDWANTKYIKEETKQQVSRVDKLEP